MSGFDPRLTSLMCSAVAGDGRAYNELLLAVRDRLRKFLERRVADSHLAQDLCQNVLLRIHAARHTFDGSQAFEPWMYAIARNVVIDHFRREARRPVAAIAADVGDVVDGSATALAEKTVMVRQAVERLSDDQAKALSLNKIMGYSMEEGARREGVSLAAFKSRVQRGFKEVLQEFYGDDDVE